MKIRKTKVESLYWKIDWNWGAYTLDRETEAQLAQAIRQRIINRIVNQQSVGLGLTDIPVRIHNSETTFSATLERIDANGDVTVDQRTTLFVRIGSAAPKSQQYVGPNFGTEFDELVMHQMMFNPSSPDPYYIRVFDSLVGIDKDIILEEVVSLLSPFAKKESWSLRHYGTVIPALNASTIKAPVILFGGDPGTGKTALATSIGAPLSLRLGEPILFRHMSLLVRGRGYHGRASSMITHFFEHVKEEQRQLKQPALIFFDEAEAVVGSRGNADGSSGAWENSAIVDAIINQVDALAKAQHVRVVVMFATNLPEQIDAAVLRRCYYHRFERPSDEVRQKLFASILQGLGLHEAGIKELVAATRPRKVNNTTAAFTQSDIVELIVGRAIEAAISRDVPVTFGLLLDYCRKAVPTSNVSAT